MNDLKLQGHNLHNAIIYGALELVWEFENLVLKFDVLPWDIIALTWRLVTYIRFKCLQT